MRSRACRSAVVAALFLVGCLAVAPLAWADDGGGSVIGGGRVQSGVTISGTQASPGSGADTAPANAGPATRVVSCDSEAAAAGCAQAIAACTKTAPAPNVPAFKAGDAGVAEVQQPDGTWVMVGTTCTGAPNAQHALIVVTPAIAREEVVRLLPQVVVGIAPADGPTVVNIQTIYWSPTTVDRDLGTVTILGLPVAIRIHFDHATYDYGDGTRQTLDSPGKPWTTNACTTAQCPDFHGHTYTHPANTTAKATVTWTATFAVNGGPAETIPGTIDGPTATHPVTIIEARSVLVR